ncbi:signal peptidase I [Tepidiforma flava]|uniref:Signal peptidase I n=1 Tax=Tepidiforma flava TaxID=3004094 RepID=A0ABY7M5S0_9CHLR|nr:signal peptidase I [Tepidiforma flava]WBL35126.1 signal peptidase I [Tepidiforma flava]
MSPAVEPDAASEEPRPWWEASEAEETVEEAVASATEPASPAVEPPAEEPRPWWETSEAEETVEEAVASISEPASPAVEPPAEEPRPWWEASEAEETVEEAVASAAEPASPAVEPASEEPRPWWEASEAAETVEEAVASAAEPVSPAVEPASEEPRPWWEASEAEETVEEAVASAAEPASPAVEPVDEEPRPWWERLGEQPVPANDEAAVPGGTPAEARFGGAEDLAGDDEDMWGDIAETAELAVSLPGGEDDLDLAASLEAQMDAADEPPWAQPSPVYDDEEPEFVSTEDEGDVILKAFEAHASTPEPEPASPEVDAETAAALEALFGSQGTQIVEETGEEPAERPFIRMAAWAPQRSAPADDGWAPAEEVAAEFERRNAPIGFELDPLAAAPPWASEPAETDGRAAERARGDGRLKAWIREVVETVMLAALVFLSVRASFGNFKVDGNSMYPTLENGQFLIVNKLVYSEVDLEKLSTFLPFINPGDDPTRYVFHGPERGDIVVLRDPRDPSTDLIKRVIGLPGETIEIVNGKVYINDRLLEEPYITTPWNDTLPKILIPPDEYFVMGDNRNNSLDSRSAQVGLVSKDLIIGKATLSYLPLNRFGLAPNQKGVLTDQKPVLTTKRLGED